MAERLKAHAWKACIRFTPYRGFESLSLRLVWSRLLSDYVARICETLPAVVRPHARYSVRPGREQRAGRCGVYHPRKRLAYLVKRSSNSIIVAVDVLSAGATTCPGTPSGLEGSSGLGIVVCTGAESVSTSKKKVKTSLDAIWQ